MIGEPPILHLRLFSLLRLGTSLPRSLSSWAARTTPTTSGGSLTPPCAEALGCLHGECFQEEDPGARILGSLGT